MSGVDQEGGNEEVEDQDTSVLLGLSVLEEQEHLAELDRSRLAERDKQELQEQGADVFEQGFAGPVLNTGAAGELQAPQTDDQHQEIRVVDAGAETTVSETVSGVEDSFREAETALEELSSLTAKQAKFWHRAELLHRAEGAEGRRFSLHEFCLM